MPLGFWLALALQAAILVATLALRDRFLAVASAGDEEEVSDR
jgi:hypothetical protein